MNYIIIVKISGAGDLNLILKTYSLGVEAKDLKKYFVEATKDFPSFFKISIEAPEDKRFSKNFTQFINP